MISFSSHRKGTQTRIRVTKQYKGIVLTEFSSSHTRAVIFGHLTPNLSRHRQPAVHFQKGQVCRMPALVEASGTIWRHIVAAERRLRGIWAQGGQSYLPVYYWSCSTTYPCPLASFFWVSNFRETGPVGNIHLYEPSDRQRLPSRHI